MQSFNLIQILFLDAVLKNTLRSKGNNTNKKCLTVDIKNMTNQRLEKVDLLNFKTA